LKLLKKTRNDSKLHNICTLKVIVVDEDTYNSRA